MKMKIREMLNGKKNAGRVKETEERNIKYFRKYTTP